MTRRGGQNFRNWLGQNFWNPHVWHLLRHSAATSMLREGISLPSIGIVLRHRSVETTAHYAKVDVELLRSVAQPWLGGAPC
jgi:site-specific recombinase XerD